MPNWCNNSIEIVGPREKIRALWAEAQKEDSGLLSAMHPRPQDLNITAGWVGADDSPEQMALVEQQKANLAKYGYKDWYDWSVGQWGTKWDVSLEGLEFEEDEDGNFDNGTGKPYARITGWFDSAWAPPVDACAFYSDANSDVRITLDYHEPGMAFVGRFTAEDGVTDDDYIEYGGFDSNTVRDAIGEEMDDFWNISEELAQYEEEENQE